MIATVTTVPADLSEWMIKCEFVEGPPLWVHPDARVIDALALADMICGQCGHQGCGYHPFHRLQPKRYIAYAVCPACGWWEEF